MARRSTALPGLARPDGSVRGKGLEAFGRAARPRHWDSRGRTAADARLAVLGRVPDNCCLELGPRAEFCHLWRHFSAHAARADPPAGAARRSERRRGAPRRRPPPVLNADGRRRLRGERYARRATTHAPRSIAFRRTSHERTALRGGDGPGPVAL